MPAGSSRPRLALVADRGGMIVLAPLIAFTLLLVVMVVAGKLFYPAPRGTYRTPAAPELQYVVTPGEVVDGDRVALRLRPGDSVWVVRLDNGAAAVFHDRTGRKVIGVTRTLLAARRG